MQLLSNNEKCISVTANKKHFLQIPSGKSEKPLDNS